MTTLPASLRAGLDGRWYQDPAVFAAEQEQVFERSWCAVLRSAELDRPGRFRTVRVGRESVIVLRDREGGLRAFLNVCRHRGARICDDGDGQAGRTLRCTYHAWAYGLDGALVAAPNLVSMPDVDRREFGLHPVHLREWLGYTWVDVTGGEPPSFEDTVIGAVTERLGDPAAVEAYDLASLAVGRRITYDVAANWKLVIENFLECYHCATIHPELTGVLPEFAKGLAAQYYVGHGAEFAPAVTGFTIDGGDGFARLPGVRPEQDRRYYAATILPQVFLNLVPDHAIVHRMRPVAPDRTVVECDWLYAPDVVATGADLDRSVELFDRVNRQDFDACERCQTGTASRGYGRGVLVPSEHHLGAFHGWLRERVPGVRG